ncbi:hypothetical protein ADL26_09430 [Thermoactinomyces vulgaris]|jgi:hypothetical protein|nr:hypothetical protein ADL26_09430 [Thermoactinomyces vulgaris]
MVKRIKRNAYTLMMTALGLLLVGGIYFSFVAPKEVEVGVSLDKQYSSVDEMKQEAQLIVEGTASTKQQGIRYQNMLFTVTDFHINKTIKGHADNKTIRILETGGFDGKNYLTVEGNKIMDKNQSYVLFLQKYQGSVTNQDAYVIIGAYQGKFAVDGNTISPAHKVAPAIAKLETKQDLIKDIQDQ